MKYLWLLTLAACGDNLHGPVVIMDVSAEAPTYGRAPYPTDAMREGDRLGVITGLDRMARGKTDLLAAHLAELDGFGLRPAVEFFIDGELAPGTVPPHTSSLRDALVVIDDDPDSPDHGAVVPMDWRYDAAHSAIVGSPSPGTTLRAGTRYVAFVTSALRGTDGKHLERASGLGSLDAPRWASTAQALAAFSQDHEVVGIAVFTTQHAANTLVAARNVLARLPVPTLAFADSAIIFDTPAKLTQLLGTATRDTAGPRAGLERWGIDNPTGMAHDHIGVVATGTIEIARFRRDDTSTDGPEDETFDLDDTGTPRVVAMESIPITFVLPKAAPPASGFPVILFGHGLGGSRTGMLNLAEPLTAQGYAVIGIDMWGHGSRYPGDPDTKNNFGGKTGFTGNRNLRDGFGDDPGDAARLEFFESFVNVAAVRDAILQSALDITRVATLVQSRPNLAALSAPYGTAPKLDPTRVADLGESFGTVVGSSVAAIEPSIGLWVLDVPGGAVLDYIVPTSAEIGSLALPFVEQIYRTDRTIDRFNPALAALQSIFDGGDPVTLASHVLRERFAIDGTEIGPRHVVMIEVIGDEIMPNAGTDALAHAFGVSVLTPDLEPPPGLAEVASPAAGNVDDQTGILVQYAPATHGYNWSSEHGNMAFKPGFPFGEDDPFPKLAKEITLFEPIYETHEQVKEILATFFAGQVPVVRSTKAPIHDFDGDGKLDGVDPDPYDPSR